MTDEELKAIEERQAARKAGGDVCVSKLHGGTCYFGELWLCLTHRDPEDTEPAVDVLLAEVKRLREALDDERLQAAADESWRGE